METIEAQPQREIFMIFVFSCPYSVVFNSFVGFSSHLFQHTGFLYDWMGTKTTF